MTDTTTTRSFLSARVSERVEVALSNPETVSALAAKGITLAEARTFLYNRTFRLLAAEAGL